MMIGSIYKKEGKGKDNTAIIYGGDLISYGRLEDCVARTAAMLRHKGVGRGDVVAIVLPNCPEFIYVVFGAWMLKAMVVPLDFRLSRDEYASIFGETNPKAVITCRQAAASVMDTLATCTESNVILKETGMANIESIESLERGDTDDVDFDAMIQYTSGTMGKAKGVVKKARAFEYEARSFACRMGYNSQDIILTVIPLYHAYAFGDALISGLYGGAKLVLEERFTGREQLNSIRRHGVTVFPGVPFMFGMLCELSDVSIYDASSLRACICAGAPLPEAVNRGFKERFGINIFPLYGSSETNTICVNTELNINGRYASVGRTIEGVEVTIRDEEGQISPRGQIGDIWIKSAIAGYGYFHQPELSAQTFKEGCVITGDVGYMDQEGLLYITGRKKSFINVGGEKVDPAEVEAAIRRHPKVKDCAVVGMADAMSGEMVKAVVVPQDAGLERSHIIDICRRHLAPYKVPRVIEFADALPMSATGKVLRKLLV